MKRTLQVFVAAAVLGTVLAASAAGEIHSLYGLVSSGGGAAFTGDLAGNDLTDSTDSIVGIAGADEICWDSATCLDGSVDGTLTTDTSAGGGNTTIQFGTATTALSLESSGSNVDANQVNDGSLVNWHVGSLIVESSRTAANQESRLDDQLKLVNPSGTPSSGAGMVVWDDEDTSSVVGLVGLGCERTGTSEHWCGLTDTTWSAGAHMRSTFRMGDMCDSDEGQACSTTCDVGLAGVLMYDPAGFHACTAEDDNGVVTYRHTTMGGLYAEIAWDANVTATTPPGSGTWVDLAGGAVEEVNGFDYTGTQLTVTNASDGRWQASLGVCYITESTGAEQYEFAIEIDDGVTPVFECLTNRDIGSGSANAVGCASRPCIFDADVGDTITVQVRQVSGNPMEDVTCEECALVLRSL